MSSKYISDYVYLAEASYTDFSKGLESVLVKDALTDDDNGGKPESFAELVTNNYTVEAHWEDEGTIFNDKSGFSGTFFRSLGDNGADSGRYVLALKGTDGGKDLLVTDGGDIVHDGLAHHQIIDMYNFWQNITKTGEYQVATIETDYALTAAYLSAQAVPGGGGGALQFFIEQNLEDKGYFIDSGEIKRIVMKSSHEIYDADDSRYNGLNISPGKVVVTGHSLGGHLSAAFSRLFPDATEHAYMFNGAGFAGEFNPVDYFASDQSFNIHEVFSFLGGVDTFDKTKITNITGDKNIDFVAQDWLIGLQQPGNQPELFIESGSTQILGHGSGQMSDSMAVLDLFMRIDPTLQEKPIAEILEQFNPVLKAMALEDGETLENLVNAIGDLYQVGEEVAVGERGGLYAPLRHPTYVH